MLDLLEDLERRAYRDGSMARAESLMRTSVSRWASGWGIVCIGEATCPSATISSMWVLCGDGVQCFEHCNYGRRARSKDATSTPNTMACRCRSNDLRASMDLRASVQLAVAAPGSSSTSRPGTASAPLQRPGSAAANGAAAAAAPPGLSPSASGRGLLGQRAGATAPLPAAGAASGKAAAAAHAVLMERAVAEDLGMLEARLATLLEPTSTSTLTQVSARWRWWWYRRGWGRRSVRGKMRRSSRLGPAPYVGGPPPTPPFTEACASPCLVSLTYLGTTSTLPSTTSLTDYECDPPPAQDAAIYDARQLIHAQLDRLMGAASARVSAQRQADSATSDAIRGLRTSSMLAQLKEQVRGQAAAGSDRMPEPTVQVSFSGGPSSSELRFRTLSWSGEAERKPAHRARREAERLVRAAGKRAG